MWSEVLHLVATPPARRVLLLEAFFALVLARLAMLFVPFRRIAAWLGTAGAETPVAAPEKSIRIAREIGWAVGVLARRVPWDSRCLAQALAGTAMLRRHGLEGTISFGAKRDDSSQFGAHAWLRFGPILVTGGRGHEQFNLFTTFARRAD